jgi:ADP-ribose pyrophosphatase YjhB (NUDIX family)
MDSKQLTTLASGILAGAAAATAIYYATKSKSNTNTVRVGVSCILLDPLTGKYVLGLRKHKEGKGMGSESWHNPGGKTEVGEALETTCCRELFEETGIVLNPSSCYQIGTTNDIMTKKDGTFQHYVTVHYLCEWNETICRWQPTTTD